MPRKSTRTNKTGVYPTPEGRWIARLRNPSTGREVSKTFTRKQDAVRWRDETKHQFARGSFVDPRAGRVKVSELSARWLTTRNVKPSTMRSYEDAVNSRINPALGDRFVNAVKEADIEDWIGSLRDEGLSASRIRKLILFTRQIFKIAVKQKLILDNPVTEEIKAPRQRPAEVVALNLEEVALLTDGMPDHYHLITLFLAGTGLRMSEVIALRVKHLDLSPGSETVLVQDAVVQLSDGRMVEGAPKSWQQRRVFIPTHVATPLREHIAGKKQTQLVFTDDVHEGEMLRPSRYAEVIKRVAGRVGIEKRVTPKVLRATAVTTAIRAGASVVTAQKLAGHESASTTLRHYSAYFPTDMDSVREKVDQAWSQTVTTETDKTDIQAGDRE